MKFTFKLFGKMQEADSLAGASAQFSALRDKSGRGSSTMPLPELFRDGELFGYFSYNGRIWNEPSKNWTPASTPIFDNAA